MRVVLAPSVRDLNFYDVIPGLRESIPHDLQSHLRQDLMPARDLLSGLERTIRSGTAPVVGGCT